MKTVNALERLPISSIIDLFAQFGLTDVQHAIAWRDLPSDTKRKWGAIAYSMYNVDDARMGWSLRESFMEVRGSVLRPLTSSAMKKFESAILGFVRRTEEV